MNNPSELFEQERIEWTGNGFSVARIAAEHKGRYTILLNGKFLSAEITGKMMFTAETRKDYPAVGDWVAVMPQDDPSPCVIHHIFPRTTLLSRKTSGKEVEEQIIAANMTIVFIVQAVDITFNLRRVERLLVVARNSGARPVILLSKIDLLDESALRSTLEQIRTIAGETETVEYSATTLHHVEKIRSLIHKDSTVCFIGSSGAGKSTLINRLIGREYLLTREVRETDAKGKHTTSHRELIPLENGGFVIDTPGMREIGLWETGEGLSETFEDIAEWALQCKFTDCSHAHEPGCAVRAALDSGELNQHRYESFLKLKKEAEYIESKSSITKQQERKAKEKQLGKLQKEVYRTRKKR